MALEPSDLHSIPLFHGMSDAHLRELIQVLKPMQAPAGKVLFQAGDLANQFMLLTDGEVTLHEDAEVRFRLRPVAPIGELGALTGLRRNTTAVAAVASELWCIPTPQLLQFFESHGEVAFPFYHNLLRVVADKIRRDNRRSIEMRGNIIRTQKAMKRMRELVLESEDTVVSKPLFETLDELIEHNKRHNYMAEPTGSLQAQVRLDDSMLVPVLEISANWLRLPGRADSKPSVGAYWSGVLVVPNGEIPISGTVEKASTDEVLVRLDLLISNYHDMLEEFLTRVHMLDFVV